LICKTAKDLRGNKKGQTSNCGSLSKGVTPQGLEPWTY
jgi:hypothetical protein